MNSIIFWYYWILFLQHRSIPNTAWWISDFWRPWNIWVYSSQLSCNGWCCSCSETYYK